MLAIRRPRRDWRLFRLVRQHDDNAVADRIAALALDADDAVAVQPDSRAAHRAREDLEQARVERHWSRPALTSSRAAAGSSLGRCPCPDGAANLAMASLSRE